MEREVCLEMLNALSEYLDGEASAMLCAEIQRHMASCGKCRVVVNTLQKTVMLYRLLPEPALPDQARERLYKTLGLSEHLTRRS